MVLFSSFFTGYVQDLSHYTAYLPREPSATPPSYATLQPATELPTTTTTSNNNNTSAVNTLTSTRHKSLAMTFTSTGAALSLPPKKKDIYRPYSLDDRPTQQQQQTTPTSAPTTPTTVISATGFREEDISAAHAILDLSASTPPLASSHHPHDHHHPHHHHHHHQQQQQQQHTHHSTNNNGPEKPIPTKTVAYTYEAFFVSDGRSKRKTNEVQPDLKQRLIS